MNRQNHISKLWSADIDHDHDIKKYPISKSWLGIKTYNLKIKLIVAKLYRAAAAHFKYKAKIINHIYEIKPLYLLVLPS